MPLNCPAYLEDQLCSECRHLWPNQTCHGAGLTPIKDILTIEERLDILEQPTDTQQEIGELKNEVSELKNRRIVSGRKSRYNRYIA